MKITHTDRDVDLADLVGRHIRITKNSGVWTGRLDAAHVGDVLEGVSWHLQLETIDGTPTTSFTMLPTDGPWTITLDEGQPAAADPTAPAEPRPAEPGTPSAPPAAGCHR